MSKLFETLVQKIIWVVYILSLGFASLIVWSNNEDFACTMAKRCWSYYPPIIILTIIFVVLAAIFQRKNKQKD